MTLYRKLQSFLSTITRDNEAADGSPTIVDSKNDWNSRQPLIKCSYHGTYSGDVKEPTDI